MSSRPDEAAAPSSPSPGSRGEGGGEGLFTSPHRNLLPAYREKGQERIDRPAWLKKYLFSTDHKIIGIQFLILGMIFFAIGGVLAMIIRWQLAWPGDGWISAEHSGHPMPILSKLLWPITDSTSVTRGGPMPPEVYNIVFTMHATIMIFFVVIPLLVGAFGNYLIPLKIGARSMAYPFLSGLVFWLMLPAGAILLSGFFLPGGAASSGWTAYPPLSAILFNSLGGVPASRSIFSLLQIQNSTWSTCPLLLAFIAFVLMFAFILFASQGPVPEVSRRSRLLLTILKSTLIFLAAILSTRITQLAAFDGQSCWFVSIIFVNISNIIGAIIYLSTIISLRCPGMKMFRLPLSVWSFFVTALIVLFATPVLTSVMVMNLLDHHRVTSFFEPYNWTLSNTMQENSGGGYALLHPHLFWFYSHPAVYIMILPAMGIVSDILPVFSRKPIFGYRAMIYSMLAIAILGFIVWGHHMYQSGMNPALGTTFAVSTMMIAVPSGIKTFNWLGTLWRGNIHFTVPMLNAIAFISLFVVGGLSGIFMASTAVDLHIHQTYFIVAHIHYVLFGGSTFGIFAGVYFWYPKMFGRMMSPTLGYIHFILSFIAFNCTFFTMHILGLQGFPRRMADYRNYTQSFAHLQPMNQFISMSAFTLGFAQVPFIINFLGSWIWGKKALDNPWNATTLEWTDTTSPPIPGNFTQTPIVYHGPYEYSSPLIEEDWLAQSRNVIKPGVVTRGDHAS